MDLNSRIGRAGKGSYIIRSDTEAKSKTTEGSPLNVNKPTSKNEPPKEKRKPQAKSASAKAKFEGKF